MHDDVGRYPFTMRFAPWRGVNLTAKAIHVTNTVRRPYHLNLRAFSERSRR